MPSSPRPPASANPALKWVAAGAVLLTLGTVLTSEAAKPSKKARIQALRQRLKSLSQKKADQRQELRETKRTQGRLADQIQASYEDLERATEALQASERRLEAAEAEVAETTERLRVAEERLREQQRLFGKRIAYYYKEGSTSYLDVLLQARDIGDFLDRQYYMDRIMDQDAALVSGLRRTQEEVRQQRLRLLERKAKLAQAHEENAQRVQLVSDQTLKLERFMKSIQKERALQEQRLIEMEEDSRGVERSLAAELSRRSANPGKYRNLPKWSGRLYMPARGPITSRFGYRTHPVLRYRRLHSGVDIGAGTGSPVYAAADGEVFFASWRGGYGKCIILLHGGGVSTLYGHLSRIDVRSGQDVRRGQRIGAVGSTGLSTGPHLHFEVRRNGVPVNPL
ncbi:MAG: murein hydrolase activator EnvC family protein [Armatimonadota bacterium]